MILTPRTDIIPILTFSTPKGPYRDLPTLTYLSPRDEFSGKKIEFIDMPTLRRHVRMQIDDGTVLEAPDGVERRGLILEVEVSGPEGRPGVKGLALIDTGARVSTIDLTVASDDLGLQANGRVDVHTASGKTTHETFACRISFPGNDGLPCMNMPKAVSSNMTDGMFIAMLGRDFLRDKVLIVDGIAGSFTLAW